ncbi:winged helix-turn-helix transcriptional regulator [Anaerosphaera multitolerans]|uniref:Winged helix-turn-helix transcriptional regulator n=2 Tax=Anaerosphaera multitolerans TaxID=2487351 RepID=A0A437S6C5_9FIRM|nr:winged helix-turn-helix transcriptional regulator [Anaerosphaera multitolerans]
MELIKENPTISQQEIADILNIQRSSVAVHINNLSKQGYILGRAYILRDEPYVTVVGGANVDIVGHSKEKLVRNDSNPGQVVQSCGGVGLNIAENISRLGIRTSLVSVVGADDRGKQILAELNLLDVDTANMFIIQNSSTSMYLAILDENRDMDVAINDMEIMDRLTPNLISKRKQIIENGEVSVIDTNLNKETLIYILETIDQKHFVDAVSVHKSEKIVDLIDKIYFLKANQYEASFLSGVEITDEKSAIEAGKILIEKGLSTLVITLGELGSVYVDNNKAEYVKSKPIKVENASGAGDAFMAGYVYSYINGYGVKKRLEFASAASRVILKSEKTNSDFLTVSIIEEEMLNVE